MLRYRLSRCLDFLSLMFAIKTLHRLNQLKKENPCHFWFSYGLALSMFCYQMTNFYCAYLYIRDGDRTGFILINDFYFNFTSFYVGKNSLIIVAILTLHLYGANMLHYTFVNCVDYFRLEYSELAKVIRLLYANGVTVLNRTDPEKLKLVARGMKLSFNRYLSFNQKLSVLWWSETLARLYLCIATGVFLMTIWFLFAFVYQYILNVLGVERLTWQLARTIAELSFAGTTIFFSITTGIFLVHLVQLFIIGILVTWEEFRVKFRQIKLPRSDAQFKGLYRQLKHCQRLFVQTYRMLHKINTFGISKVFKMSVLFTLAMNIVCIIELFIGTFRQEVRLLIVFLIGLQFFIFFGLVLVLLLTSRKLYALNRQILQFQTLFARHRFRSNFRLCRVRALVRWSCFIEIVHTRRKFAFSLGNYGRITSWNLLKAIPIYTSLIMFIAPFVFQENNIQDKISIT